MKPTAEKAPEGGANKGPFRPNESLQNVSPGTWKVTGPRPGFELDPAAFAGRWVICSAMIHREFALVGLSFYIKRRDTSATRITQPFVTHPGGRASWIGHIPADAERIRLDVMASDHTFRLTDFRIRTLSRLELVGRAARVDVADAVRSAGWRVLGKRMRARGQLSGLLYADLMRQIRGNIGDGGADEYARWRYTNEALATAELDNLRAHAEAWTDPPSISVLMPVYNPKPADLEAAIASVRAQIYPHWDLSIADDASTDPRIAKILNAAAAADTRIHVVRRAENGHISAASNTALEGCRGTFTALMDHDDLLPPQALLFVAQEIVQHPEADLIYSDEDKVDERGRRYMPHFKSDWNEELFLAQNYLSHLGVYRTEILRRIGGFRIGLEGSQDHDLVLRFLDHTDETRIRHIPRILYHWRNHRETASFSEKSAEKTVATRRRALADHVARRGWDAEVVEGVLGFNRLRRRLPDPLPSIAVIVPTRDRAGLLRVAADGVLTKTDYPALQFVVIDNDSVEPETSALFAELRRDPRVTILAQPGPFNFSTLNNAAVAAVESEFLLFLNNDIEVISDDWLREMASCLVPGVAAVGAKLLYPNRTVQHAGVVLGAGGIAGHAFLDLSEDDPGHFGRAVLPQYVSAVTAACMLVRRSSFDAVGGFDAEKLAVAFNDIDLCLKLRERGWKIVFDPYAVLLHHESVSRGLETTPEKRARFETEISTMLDRWGPVLKRDPYYNPNLELDFADYRLRGVYRPTPPRHGKD